ncbi:MAG: hypothetical protein JXB38_18090 [Anaerolineales bacterium]|nr:hypothetical protein [Anaerolineales bacterium]
MPIHYLIDNDHRCVIKLWIGEITLEDWLIAERQVMEAPNLPRNFKMLIDARKVSAFKIGPENVDEIVDFYETYQDKVNGVRVAMLAGAFFKEAKMYERNVQPLGMNVIVFANFDTACTWLNLDQGLVNEYLQQLQQES